MEEVPFIGDWYVERKLGSGSYGSVHLWKNKKTKESIAIKRFLLPDNQIGYVDDFSRQKERWENEISLLTDIIKCENIVRPVKVSPASFLEQLQQGPFKVLPLEFCEGGDLRRVLDKSENVCCGLRESEVRDVLRSLRNAISYLHGLKITHRDLKPENIVLKLEEGGKVVYKLTDLGLARDLDGSSINASFVGTMEYLAPELLTTGKYSNSVDYWSFGIMAVEMICGVRPFLPHCPIARWMVYAQKKTSEDICISEDNNERFTYHKELFAENRISRSLTQHLSKWLQLALEWNPKQRGFTFKSSPRAGEKPLQSLEIFTSIDDILKKKFLIVFSLFNYAFMSIEVTESTTMAVLLEKISAETGIPVPELELVLPLEQSEVKEITELTRPVDLYLPEYVDQPMLYVLKSGVIYSPTKPTIPKSIEDVFRDVKVRLKPHMLRQFARNAVFFVHSEQRLYTTLLTAIRTYALDLNDRILRFKPSIVQMLRDAGRAKGAFEQFNQTLEHTKTKLSENEPISQAYVDQCEKVDSNINALGSASEKISRRFDSVLRRSQEVMNSELLRSASEDIFNEKVMNVQFNLIRTQIADRKAIDEKSHINILNSVYGCLKKRDKLLLDTNLKAICARLVEVKIEVQEILKAVELADTTEKSLRRALAKLTDEHMNTIWSMGSNRKSEYLPDFEGIMPKFKIGEAVHAAAPPKGFLWPQEASETQSLISECQNLISNSHDVLDASLKFIKEIESL